jgi:thioredoxin 1
VDFWAEWCGPCKKIAPVLEELAEKYAGQVEIVKLNTDENPNTTRNYGVMSIPTLTVFKGGEPVQSVVGAQPKSSLAKLIESAL